MKKFRRPDKRRAMKEYRARSKDLNDSLIDGTMKQDEFDRAHDLLDEQYSWLR